MSSRTLFTNVANTVRKAKVFKDVWQRRIEYAISQLIAARIMLGKVHEKEAGLAIARFIKETWKSISVARKIEKLAQSGLGRAYIVSLVVDNVAEEKRYALLQQLGKLGDVEGLDFLERLDQILRGILTKEEYERIIVIQALLHD